VSAAVSYVPVLGSLVGFGTPDGPLVVVTDGKELGTESLVQKLARLISKRPIWIVNATDPDVYRGLRNVAFLPYVTDMDEVWAKAGILIYPNYGNDVCGTSRVAPEAMRWGVPCLANDRAGICETGMCSIPRDASPAKWAMAIEKIYSRYRSFSDRARTTFERYDTPAQLAVFERAVQNAFDEEL
jgi:glycosyltransferase involved in cell wall biosynthesis